MQDIHHDDVCGRIRGEWQVLRVGDAIEPWRKLDIGRNDIGETRLEIPNAAADLDGNTWHANTNDPIVEVGVDQTQNWLAAPCAGR